MNKKQLCEVDIDVRLDDFRHEFNESFLGEQEDDKYVERHICQMVRLDGFSEDGSVEISIDVPLNAHLFESYEEAVGFGEKNNGTMMVFKGFWGADYKYEDLYEIYCGYIVYSIHSKEYDAMCELTDDRRIEAEKMCSPSLLVKLQEAYDRGGQKGMYEWAKFNL